MEHFVQFYPTRTLALFFLITKPLLSTVPRYFCELFASIRTMRFFCRHHRMHVDTGWRSMTLGCIPKVFNPIEMGWSVESFVYNLLYFIVYTRRESTIYLFNKKWKPVVEMKIFDVRENLIRGLYLRLYYIPGIDNEYQNKNWIACDMYKSVIWLLYGIVCTYIMMKY